MAIETTPALKAAGINVSEVSTSEARSNDPIIIDLGKKKRKLVKKLRKGKQGRLMNKVLDVLEEVKSSDAVSSGQAVVVIVREKKKTRKYGKVWGLG